MNSSSKLDRLYHLTTRLLVQVWTCYSCCVTVKCLYMKTHALWIYEVHHEIGYAWKNWNARKSGRPIVEKNLQPKKWRTLVVKNDKWLVTVVHQILKQEFEMSAKMIQKFHAWPYGDVFIFCTGLRGRQNFLVTWSQVRSSNNFCVWKNYSYRYKT